MADFLTNLRIAWHNWHHNHHATKFYVRHDFPDGTEGWGITFRCQACRLRYQIAS